MFGDVPPAQARCRVVYVSPLKALAVDVERNLRVPLAGMAALAEADGVPFHVPTVAVRTGDTPQAERARFRRAPADILITTPESLYLLLTSDARLALRSVTTLIVDEVHALVPTKRGAHLALSLERLEHLCGRPLQRIGLSATQRPLEEVARYLGGAKAAVTRRRAAGRGRGSANAETALHGEFEDQRRAPVFRPVTIVDTGERKRLDLRIDVPVDDMARLAPPAPGVKKPTQVPGKVSIWTAIHPRLVGGAGEDLRRGPPAAAVPGELPRRHRRPVHRARPARPRHSPPPEADRDERNASTRSRRDGGALVVADGQEPLVRAAAALIVYRRRSWPRSGPATPWSIVMVHWPKDAVIPIDSCSGSVRASPVVQS